MKKGDILALEIIDLAFGGKGIAKIKIEKEVNNKKEFIDFVLFVDGALPGQTVEARITKKKRRYAEAKCIKITKKSDLEIETGFQSVPGAPWATLPIEIQQKFKKAQVLDLFKKFAETNLDESIFDEYLSSPQDWQYRNKMEYSFGPTEETASEPTNKEEKPVWHHSGFGLGSKKRGQYWLVENLEKPSGLFDEAFEKIIPTIRAFCEESKLPVYNARTNQGFFRNLIVRKSFDQDKLLVNLVTTSLNKENLDLEGFTVLLKNKLGDKLGGVLHTIHDGVSDAMGDAIRACIFGEDILTEKINGLTFEMSLDSFFQTNIKSAENLYKKALSYLDISDEGVILDLFCGTGTIGQIVAKQFPEKEIIGVELIKEAIKDAEINAEINEITNIKFKAEDVGAFLKNNPELQGKIGSIILDPPRSGIAPKTLQKVLDLESQSIIYVSCNPATMARDTKLLCEAGYKLEKFSLVDQFPHTAHVECIGKFIKK